jgi:hypothetical protein
MCLNTEPVDVVEAVQVPPVPSGLSKPPVAQASKHDAKNKEVVNVNSGFIVAFDITSALDAIHEHPIGRIRPGKCILSATLGVC